MIRIETGEGYVLVGHREHALLAGRFAAHWGNPEFLPPSPRPDVLVAVDRHDDAWRERDRMPYLTREGRPSAFSQELVGAYSAFEEIVLADYLAVRGRAAELVAADNPFAAAVISMHTIDLLTERADPRGLSEADRGVLADFVAGLRRRQEELVAVLRARPDYAAQASAASLLRAFEFLQACDSLSLTVCCRYPRPLTLRHPQPRRDGTSAVLECIPLGNDTYRVTPYPFDADDLRFDLPSRWVPGLRFSDQAAFRAAYAAAPSEVLQIRLLR